MFNGRDKLFFFGDYEGLRRRQGTTLAGTVPTALERNSDYTDFSDLITLQGGSGRPDTLGRHIPLGTILDPATTRPVTAGQVDPVPGLTATATGFVRDPFSTCAAGTLDFTGCEYQRLQPEYPPSDSVGRERHQVVEAVPATN